MLTSLISAFLAAILTIVGLLHALWGFGVTFPAANEQQLARMVVGKRGITKMPSMTACLFVAFSCSASPSWRWCWGVWCRCPCRNGWSRPPGPGRR